MEGKDEEKEADTIDVTSSANANDNANDNANANANDNANANANDNDNTARESKCEENENESASASSGLTISQLSSSYLLLLSLIISSHLSPATSKELALRSATSQPLSEKDRRYQEGIELVQAFVQVIYHPHSLSPSLLPHPSPLFLTYSLSPFLSLSLSLS